MEKLRRNVFLSNFCNGSFNFVFVVYKLAEIFVLNIFGVAVI